MNVTDHFVGVQHLLTVLVDDNLSLNTLTENMHVMSNSEVPRSF